MTPRDCSLSSLGGMELKICNPNIVSCYSLRLDWKDNRLAFIFLKDESARNTISRIMLEDIWIPKIQYLLVYEEDIKYISFTL